MAYDVLVGIGLLGCIVVYGGFIFCSILFLMLGVLGIGVGISCRRTAFYGFRSAII